MPEPAAVEDLFLAALDRPPADRDAFVAAACAGDPDRLRRVRELLAAHHRSRGPLDSPPMEGPTTALPPTAEGSGATIGGYRLIEPIGEGGMGEVWLAQQQEPVKRLVALKVIRAGLDSKQVLARFEAERQALALMDHPHIAKVLEAGATPEGRPFFVMELVKGTPITKYCDEHRLTPKQRLELFVQVCQAVQHAHQKGVIHRDLKPSNVLVAPYDGVPVVKVIDFGVAKAAGVSLTDKTLVTGLGAVVGTPEYMSPEQAELNNADIDTRSDVYALGVLLYELLTGTTPLTRGRVKEAALLEVLRVIREEEPPKPSARLSTTAELPSIAAVRGVEPARLSKLVRGDLDWIVMKALEKDRGRRYETAVGFGLDVQRYLADEPVLAGPPGTGYRLRKFVRRNRGAVIAASAVVILLAAGVVGTTTGLVRALASEKKLVHERDDKEEARREARQALNTMTDEVIEDLLGQQPELTDKHRAFLKKVLAYHIEYAAAQADDPDGQFSRSEGFFRVGRIRRTLGETAEAEAAFREALAIQRKLVDEHPDREEFRRGLVQSCIEFGQLLGELTTVAIGDGIAVPAPNRELAAIYREGMDHAKVLRTKFPGSDYRRDLAVCEYDLATFLYYSGQLDESEPLIRDSLALTNQLATEFPDSPKYVSNLADGYEQLARSLLAARRSKDAQEAHHAAVENYQKLEAMYRGKPEFREELAQNYLLLGVLYNLMRDRDKAEVAFHQAVTLGKELAAEFPRRPVIREGLAMTQNNLGKLLFDAGKTTESEAAFRDSVGLLQKLTSELRSRPDLRILLADNHHNLGVILMHTDRKKKGEEQWRAGVEICRRLVSEFSGRSDYEFKLAFQCDEMAHFLRETDRRPAAIEHWREAAKHYQKIGALGNSALARFNMGQTFNSMGRPADAIAEFRAALEAETDFPEARTNLGRALADSGDPAAGIAELRKALQTKKKFPEAHIAHTNLGNALLALDRRPEAIAAYQDALRVNPKYADAYYGLGNAYFPGKPADAVDAYRRAIELNPNDGQYHNNLGNALAVSGDLEGAIAEFREALGLDKDLSQAHHNLGRALLENGQFNEAVAEYRVAVQLQKDNAEWREHLRQAEEMTRLDDRLPVVLAGKDKPADGAQALAFAHLCQLPLRGQNVAAARFFGEAFDRDPKLAENLETGDRYNAACAAALAAAGKGKDAGKLDDNERARLRQQALDWLRADLAAWRRVIDQEPQKAPTAAEVLRHWLDDTDFAAVRGKEALAKLREAERKAWQKLWDDATGMRKRSAETPAKKQPEPK